MKRVVVLGGTGMAGHVVAAFLEERGYDVYIVSKSAKSSPKSEAIDATDFSRLAAWLHMVEPNVIVNCIGVLQKQADERPDLAILLNAYLPQWLAHTFKDTHTKIIHLSTDCVFSGKHGNYTEADEPDGATMYDRSKALGEIQNQKDLTFRMSIIGPDRNESGTGLFHWFMGQKGEISGYTNVIWNGVTTLELARAIDAAIGQDLCGMYQLTPRASIDKYHLLLLFKEIFSKNDILIIPFEGVYSNKTLKNTRFDFMFKIREYPEQIADLKNWVLTHQMQYGERYR